MSEFVMGASVHLDNNFSATMSAMTSDTERFKATADSANTSVSNLDKSLNGLRTDAFKSVSGTATEAAKSANQAADATNRIVAPMNNVVTSTNRAQNAIQSFNRGWEKVKSLPGTLKNVGTTLKSNVVNGLTSARLQASVLTASIKTLGAQKLNGLVSSVKQFKSTITEGKTGVTGFTNALKNLGKISVVGAVNSVGKLGSKLKEVVGTNVSTLSSKFKSLTSSFKSSENGSNSLFAALKKVAGVSMEKLHSGISKIGTLAGKAAVALGNGMMTAMRVATGAIAAGAAAAGAIVMKSVNAFGDYQQLTGGVETLFKDSAGIVEQYANDAFKTAGLSANDYMETVTSFSASLLQSVNGDTAKAAEYANTAIKDMADNSNKMGTGMDAIQNAYQGFAKQNYTMLDNLKLGYGGTKTEMERLLKDANELNKAQGKFTNYSIDSYADIVAAIHDVQKSLGITGTTAQEAEHTIQGSAASMRAAWNNMLVSLVTGGEDFDRSVKNLVSSVKTFASNILPAVKSALGGLAQLVQELAPMIAQELPGLINDILPPLISATTAILTGLANALPQLITTVVPAILNGITQVMQSILNVFSTQGPQIILALMNALNNAVQTMLGMLPQFVNVASQIIIAIIQGLAAAAPTLIPAIVQAILGMINSIVQNIPMFIQAGLQLIMGLVQGIFNAIPILVQMAPVIIQNLVSGLIAMLPQIIQTGIQMIVSIIQGIIQNLPQILQAAVQIVVTLAVGLIQAIPQLIAAIPQLVSAIIDTILSTNWLDVGWQIVSGIGKGLWDGITGIFGGGGEEGGAAVSQGAATGITSNLGTVTGATTQLSQTMTQGLQPDVATANMMGAQTVTAITDGMNSVDMSATAGMVGTNLTTGIVTGIDAGSASVTAAATGMTEQANAAVSAGMSNMSTTINTLDISGFEASCDGMINAITEGVTICEQTVSTGMQNIVSIVSSVDLYSAGVNIMQGLNNGMQSMQGSIMATAQSIANSVKSTINSALQIHSPSRVLEESGEYTGEGFANGLMNLIDKVRANAQALADTTVKPFSVSGNADDIAVSGRYDTGRSGETRSGLSVMIDKLILQDVGNKDPKQLVREIISELATQMGDTDELLSDIGMGVLL